MKLRPGVLILLLASVGAYGTNCVDLERSAENKLSMVGTAADDLGPFRAIGNEALEGVKQCPGSERLWYLAARSAEVLELPFQGRAFADEGGLKKILADALSHEPRSAPIATIAARTEGGTAAARRALALDPGYAPARRTLAVALAQEGSINEALRISKVRTPAGADHLAAARVLLAANRPAEAIREARAALSAGTRGAVEPTPSVEIQRDGNEVLGFALLKQRRRVEADRAFRIAAAAGSVTAQRQLSSSK